MESKPRWHNISHVYQQPTYPSEYIHDAWSIDTTNISRQQKYHLIKQQDN
jgi:hypothetical protein